MLEWQKLPSRLAVEKEEVVLKCVVVELHPVLFCIFQVWLFVSIVQSLVLNLLTSSDIPLVSVSFPDAMNLKCK